jgi:uncharacterized transporter YbjL
MPLLPELELQRRDVLKLYGPAADMPQVVPLFGVRVVHSVRSNISYMAAGILLGVFIGGFSIKLGGIPFSLGGALLSGLLFGWYRAKRQTSTASSSSACSR